MSSVAGIKVFPPGGTVYSGTKFAVSAISEGLRHEVGEKVRVTSIEPGAVESDLKFTTSGTAAETVLDKGTASGTDWVVTFPTKTFYYDKKPSDKELKVLSLFQRNFKSTGACDDISLVRYDREEKQIKTSNNFSPPPPTKTDSLCWEANVISFNSSNVLASKNVANLPTTFEHGWAELAFPAGVTGIPPTSLIHALIGGTTTQVSLQAASIGTISTWNFATYYGLPVIGFAAITYSNGNVGGTLSNYGGNFNHKYTRRVSPGN